MTNLSGTNLNNGAAVGPQGEGRESPSSFPAYPAYKDSGVEWLGEIPGHWAVFIAKRMFGNVRESASADAEQLAATQAYGVIPQKDFMERNDTKVVLALSGTENFRAVKANDFVISLRSFQGGIEHSAYDGCVSPAYTVLRRKDERNLNPGYLRYLLKDASYISALQSVTTGIREGRTITYEQFGSLSMPAAPVAEQTQIARFLDHETARIDALIEEQQRLIELLKEKRQAVISHAVTKGLDPTVPMKDSGVEWLGEVPCSWRVIKFGITHETAELGGNYESGESEEGLPLIKMGNIGRGKIKLDKVEYVSAAQNIDDGHILREGDFLFNTRNSLDLVGKVCVWRSELSAALYNSNILRISFDKNLVGSSGFVNYLLNSDLGLEQLRLIARGTTSVAAIYYKDLSSLSFAFPSPSEQLEIEKFLDIQTTKLDALVVVAEQAIDLIKERRSALISAAVTGKIDVRDWQPTASTQAPELEVAEAD